MNARPYPTWHDLDLIARARLRCDRADQLPVDATLYVRREELEALFRWPDDASLSGFQRTHEGFAFRGRAIRGTP